MATNWQGIGQIVLGIVLVVAGTYFANPAVVGAGWGLIVSGSLSVVAGLIFKPSETEANDERASPTYGFRAFDNPVKGDSVLPVIYSNDADDPKPGHKVAPVYLQAFTTPRGFEMGDDDAKIISARGQGLSALLAVGCGPVAEIYDVRANDEPLFDERTGYVVREKTPSGVKTYTIPLNRIEIDSVRIYVNGTLRGWRDTNSANPDGGNRVLVATGNGTRILHHVDLAGRHFKPQGSILFYDSLATNVPALPTTGSTGLRPHAWLDAGGRSGRASRLYINTQVPLANGQRLYATWEEQVCDGLTLSIDHSTGDLKIVFDAAPTANSKITADFRRRRIPGLRVETRRGGDVQLPIPEFSSVRNTTSIGTTLAQGSANAVELTTKEEVDDVIVDLGSVDGFTQFDSTDGSRSPVSAQFRVQYQALAADGVTPKWALRDLRDPAGSRPNKAAIEFEMRGDQLSTKFYSLSLKNVLREIVEREPGNTRAKTDLADFKRARYRVVVWRTNAVRAGSYVQDQIQLLSYQTVSEIALMYPGVALLGIHAFASERLQGGAPRITCKVKGLRLVEAYNPVTERWLASETNQSNPVWAAIDLITNTRYGAGAQFTKAANIDLEAAVAAAGFCEEHVPTQGLGTLSIVRNVSVVAPSTFRRQSGAWSGSGGDGYVVGQRVNAAGYTVPGNNGTFVVASISGSDLVVEETSLVTEAGSTTKSVREANEKRAVLDYVIDVRGDLMSHVRNMLMAAQIVPVLRGNVWSFFVDREVADLTACKIVNDDGVVAGADEVEDGRTFKSSLSFSHAPLHTKISELQVSYFDRADDFERNEVWRAPTAPAENRRVERATAHGVARATQATRYAEFLYRKATMQGVNVGWAMAPGGLRLQVGDVVRVVSNRFGADVFVRITKWELDSTESYVIRIEGAEYVPAAYSTEEREVVVVPRAPSSGQSAPVNTPDTVAANGDVVRATKVRGRVRRVA